MNPGPGPLTTSAPQTRQVVISANPYSGARDNRQCVAALSEALTAAGLEPRLGWSLDEVAGLMAEPAFADACRCLVAAGGDGTLNRVVNYLPRVPIAMFPLGNENLFARQFGHSANPAAMAKMIADGRTTTIDLARANGRVFAILASAGFDADVVHRLAHWREKSSQLKRVRSRSYFKPIFVSACRYAHPMIRVEADGEKVEGALVVISNLPQYCANLRIAPQAIASDGLLDWIVFTRPGRIRFLSYLRSVVLGRHHLRSDIRQGRAREIRLTADCPVPLQIDGEVAGFTPAVIDTLPAALRVLVTD